jgi:hypothetical protein
MPVLFVAQCASINAFITPIIPSSTVILMEIVSQDGLDDDIHSLMSMNFPGTIAIYSP